MPPSIAILGRGLRCKGRGPGNRRQLSAETGPRPRSHGTALFARGKNQALAPSPSAFLIVNLKSDGEAFRHEGSPPRRITMRATWDFHHFPVTALEQRKAAH